MEREGDDELESRVTKMRVKVETEDQIRKEVETRRKQMRKLMQQRNLDLAGARPS